MEKIPPFLVASVEHFGLGVRIYEYDVVLDITLQDA